MRYENLRFQIIISWLRIVSFQNYLLVSIRTMEGIFESSLIFHLFIPLRYSERYKGRSPLASAAIATLASMIFALRKDYVMRALGKKLNVFQIFFHNKRAHYVRSRQ